MSFFNFLSFVQFDEKKYPAPKNRVKKHILHGTSRMPSPTGVTLRLTASALSLIAPDNVAVEVLPQEGVVFIYHIYVVGVFLGD